MGEVAFFSSEGPDFEEAQIGEDRTVGESEGPANLEALKKARRYWAYVQECVEVSPCNVQKVVAAGDDLIRTARSVEGAVIASRQAWDEVVPHHLDGVYDQILDELCHPVLVEYVRYVREHGPPSRVAPSSERAKCRPHSKYLDHQQEGMEKTWKELRAGRVLMISSASEPYLKGLRSSPYIQAIKLTITREISPDGRFAHDPRAVNATGSKYDLPPALQPTVPSVAKRAHYLRAIFPRVSRWGSRGPTGDRGRELDPHGFCSLAAEKPPEADP